MRMLLAADASALVAEALRARGRALVADPALELVCAAEAWSETEHEVRRRVRLLIERGALEDIDAVALLAEALKVLAAHVTVVAHEIYTERLAEAVDRVPADPRDAPTVALALALDCGVWTADRDFFGCGVPVWTTETLLRYLAARRNAE